MKSKIFIKGVMDVMPLQLSVIPFGIIFGVIGIELGFGAYITFGMSFIIFGGASQVVFAQLLYGGATPIVLVSSVAVVNSRHLLYGAVIAQFLEKLSLSWKIVLSYFMTDQAWIVSYKYLKTNNSQYAYYHLLGSGIFQWFIWQTTTLIGIILGSVVPDELGLSFAVPLTFLSLIVLELRKIDHLIVVVTSGLSALLFYEAPLKTYIILSALVGIFAAYILLIIKEKKRK